MIYAVLRIACIRQIQEKRVVARVKSFEGKMLVKLVCRYAGLSFIGLSFSQMWL